MAMFKKVEWKPIAHGSRVTKTPIRTIASWSVTISGKKACRNKRSRRGNGIICTNQITTMPLRLYINDTPFYLPENAIHFPVNKADIRNPLSLLAHERSCFAACVHFISTLHFSSFFDHKFTTFTTNLTLLYNTRQNDWCLGKPVKQALLGYTRQNKNQLPLSRGEC